jgi:hypothetical protein
LDIPENALYPAHRIWIEMTCYQPNKPFLYKTEMATCLTAHWGHTAALSAQWELLVKRTNIFGLQGSCCSFKLEDVYQLGYKEFCVIKATSVSYLNGKSQRNFFLFVTNRVK